MSSTVALENYLKPLMPFLTTEGVTEVCINAPQSVWVEKDGVFSEHRLEKLHYEYLLGFAEVVAEFNGQAITEVSPILAGNLLNGERIQLVRPPACEKDKVVIAIRRHQLKTITLDDYQTNGAFDEMQQSTEETFSASDKALIKYHQQGNFLAFIKTALLAKKNILISGGTGTGKTTFLNACLKQIPGHERLITIEDSREVNVEQPNHVNLLMPNNRWEHQFITPETAFETCLRLRPDRIFLSEIRGREVFAFLEAINSGHPGSLSTIHADNAEGAFEQLYRKIRRCGDKTNKEEVLDYLKSIIHIVVQLKRASTADKFTLIEEIYFDELHYG